MGAGYRFPVPDWNLGLWKCVLCGVEDHPVFLGSFHSETGEPIFDHFVQIDQYFLKRAEDLTAKDKATGFHFMSLDGGRPAKVRTICRTCMEEREQISKVWKDFEKSRQEMQEQNKDLSWYAQLCQ